MQVAANDLTATKRFIRELNGKECLRKNMYKVRQDSDLASDCLGRKWIRSTVFANFSLFLTKDIVSLVRSLLGKVLKREMLLNCIMHTGCYNKKTPDFK